MFRYQILMALALPVALAHQALTGPKGALAERLGYGPSPGPGAKLWLHAASVGEVTSARWVVEDLLAARPGLQILITVNTATARDRVRGWALPGVTASLAPVDSAGAAGRLLDRWQPQALVIVENELWPARIAAAHGRGVPVLVIGAKLSARSARRWGWFPRLIRQVLGRLSWVSAQDEASLERLKALGLPPEAAGPVVALKAMAEAAPALPPPFQPPTPRTRTLLAASTHEGEEALVLTAFQAARGQFDWLILAPRHPRRSAEVQAMLAKAGVVFATRTRGEAPKGEVYLADTLGEMDHWYAMAGATVIGGTFAPKGGHTPWEPARHGTALVHGPSLHNFAPPFAALDRAEAAVPVQDGAQLAATLAGLSPDRQTLLASRAAEVLAPGGAGRDEVTGALLQVIRG